MNIFYTGEVLSNNAFVFLKSHQDSYLVDVRTYQEWVSVGIPDISSINKEVIFLSWRVAPQMEINKSFVLELSSVIKDKDAVIYFLCKSGSRSAEAAVAFYNFGYRNSYNVSYGFEGENIGWKALSLPWRKG
ncbi:MAG: rhodanese-like domain-containing protein [Candidatus Midichloria sp.]|nr:MAG: rhodanese-like domain-containing protein [Candidatus Midichloria sp.]